jgi:photosynthetic reaction center cytochrome c subunit
MTKRFLSGTMLCGLLWVLSAAVPAAQDMRPSEVAYKNIRVLTGVPANQVIQGMHVIKTALGVDCTYCHIEAQWDREDVQPMKNKARAMMTMVKEINDANFEGRQVVTCFTCHKGKAVPEDAPSMPAPPITEHISTEIYPPVDDILKKYITALGGEAALKKVTSRVLTASVNIPTGPGGTVSTPATLERSLKAPNLALDVYTTPKFSISNGFDGKAPWAKGQNGNVNSPPPTSPDAERLARAANFYEPLMLRDLYATMRVVGREKVGTRDAYVVSATPIGNTAEKLYFDVVSGLLVRKSSYLETAVGKSPLQVDYSDYRLTNGGVKVPFLVKMAPAGMRTEIEPTSTMRVTRVVDNAPLDDAKFVRPMPTPPPARR